LTGIYVHYTTPGYEFITIFQLLIVSEETLVNPVSVYASPGWGKPVTSFLILIAFILFSAAHSKSNIRRFIRHPQLIGLVIWSVGHLLSNGDNRSIVLFGTLGIWAITEIILIDKREGTWIKPDSASIKSELLMLIKGFAIFAAFLLAHPYIAGVPVIAR